MIIINIPIIIIGVSILIPSGKKSKVQGIRKKIHWRIWLRFPTLYESTLRKLIHKSEYTSFY